MTTDPWGIDVSYQDAAGVMQQVSEETLAVMRSAIGRREAGQSWLDGHVKVVRQGESVSVPSPCEITLEDGTSLQIRDQVPETLPIGYHWLTPNHPPSTRVRLIVSPGQCHFPNDLRIFPNDLRIWGWNAQLYAVRSRESWGLGDLADLRQLARWAEGLGAGLILINPLHAVSPVLPQEASPYSPSSRRFLNPLYLRIEEVPYAAQLGPELHRLAEMGRALNHARVIDRDEVFRLKYQALSVLWSRFTGDEAFDRFVAAEGESLRVFSCFNALAERHGGDWRTWPVEYHRPDSAAAQRFAHEYTDRVRFHAWLQWLLHRQLAEATRSVPVMQDLPIGFSRSGMDAWMWQDLLALDMSVGAPPDLYNSEGQDWGLPPFIPHKLAEAAYEPFIQTIRAVLRHAGGLRVDHVMGLFRLWWVPCGGGAKYGAYVRYPADDLLAILALESHRAQAVVVGEDLGTVEPGVRETLAERNVLSYRLLWFEDEPPTKYPKKALAAITTHDLPTLAGIWTGADLHTQQRLGLAADAKASQQFREKLVQTSGLSDDAGAELAIKKTFEQLAQAPSAIVMATMEAACAATERPNMPTGANKYPNWSMALPLTLEQLEAAEHPRALANILSRRTDLPPHLETPHAN